LGGSGFGKNGAHEHDNSKECENAHVTGGLEDGMRKRRWSQRLNRSGAGAAKAMLLNDEEMAQHKRDECL
jgi:hypothetical protein